MPVEYLLYAIGIFFFLFAVVWPAWRYTKDEIGGAKGIFAFIGILVIFILVGFLFSHPPGYVGWPF